MAPLPPPHAPEAEQSVLGALLLHPDAFDRIEFLRPEHFYTQDHKLIFGAIASLIERGKGCDTLLVAHALEAQEKLADAGGYAYLGLLAANTPSAANIRHYAEIVHEHWRLRRLIACCWQLADQAHAPGANARALAQEAEAALLEIEGPTAGITEPVLLKVAVGEAIDAREEPARVVPTGFANVDAMLSGGGMKPGQLVIVAGRSSMGKSALAAGIAEHVSRGRTVAYFSLEMSRVELALRPLVHHERLIGTDAAIAHLAQLPLVIDDAGAVTLSHVRLTCRRIRRQHGLGLIVIDYLQLMTGHGENRTQEIGSPSRGLPARRTPSPVP